MKLSVQTLVLAVLTACAVLTGTCARPILNIEVRRRTVPSLNDRDVGLVRDVNVGRNVDDVTCELYPLVTLVQKLTAEVSTQRTRS